MDRVSGLLNQPTHFFPEFALQADLTSSSLSLHRLINPLIPNTLNRGAVKSRLGETFKITLLVAGLVILAQIALLVRNYLTKSKPLAEKDSEMEIKTPPHSYLDRLILGENHDDPVKLCPAFTACLKPELEECLPIMLASGRKEALIFLAKLEKIPPSHLRVTKETLQYNIGKKLDQVGRSFGIETQSDHINAYHKLYETLLINKVQLQEVEGTLTKEAQERLKDPSYTFLTKGSGLAEDELSKFLELFEKYSRIAEGLTEYTQSQHVAFCYLARLICYMQSSWIQIHSSSRDGKAELSSSKSIRLEEFKAALQNIISRFADADTNCVDQVLSQTEDLIGETLTYFSTNLGKFRSHTALTLINQRREVLKQMISRDHNGKHQADFERAIAPHVQRALDLPEPRIIKQGAQFGSIPKLFSKTCNRRFYVDSELESAHYEVQAQVVGCKYAAELRSEFDPIEILVNSSITYWGRLHKDVLEWYSQRFKVEEDEEVSNSPFLKAIFPEGKTYTDYELRPAAVIFCMICEGVIEIPADLFSGLEASPQSH